MSATLLLEERRERARKAWFRACKRGSLSRIREHLASGFVDVLSVDHRARNCLHVLFRSSRASAHRKLRIFDYIMEVSDNNTSLLFQTCKRGRQPLSMVLAELDTLRETKRAIERDIAAFEAGDKGLGGSLSPARRDEIHSSDCALVDDIGALLLSVETRLGDALGQEGSKTYHGQEGDRGEGHVSDSAKHHKRTEGRTNRGDFNEAKYYTSEREREDGADEATLFRERLANAFADDAHEYGFGSVDNHYQFADVGAPHEERGKRRPRRARKGIDEMTDEEYAAYMRSGMGRKQRSRRGHADSRNSDGDEGNSGSETDADGSSERRGEQRQQKRHKAHARPTLHLQPEETAQERENRLFIANMRAANAYLASCERFFASLKAAEASDPRKQPAHQKSQAETVPESSSMLAALQSQQHNATGSGQKLPPPSPSSSTVSAPSVLDVVGAGTECIPFPTQRDREALTSGMKGLVTQQQKQQLTDQVPSDACAGMAIATLDQMKSAVKQAQRWWHPDTWTRKLRILTTTGESHEKNASADTMDGVHDALLQASKFFNQLRSDLQQEKVP